MKKQAMKKTGNKNAGAKNKHRLTDTEKRWEKDKDKDRKWTITRYKIKPEIVHKHKMPFVHPKKSPIPL